MKQISRFLYFISSNKKFPAQSVTTNTVGHLAPKITALERPNTYRHLRQDTTLNIISAIKEAYMMDDF